MAGHGSTKAVTTIKAVTSVPKVKVNRYIQDGLRWDKDVYTVKSGSTIKVVNNAADEGPHTFTVVVEKDTDGSAVRSARIVISAAGPACAGA